MSGWFFVSLGLVILIVFLGFVVFRLSRKLLQFDEIFEMLQDDITTNVGHFDKMRSSSLLSDAAEVIEAHRNMSIMGKRLDEFSSRMREVTHAAKGMTGTRG